MKALLVGQKISHINLSFKNVLEKNGIETILIAPLAGLNRNNYIQRIKNRLHFNLDSFYIKQRNLNSIKVMDIYKKNKPDIVIFLRGLQINKKSLEFLNRKSITVLTLTDSIQRYPAIYDIVKEFDLVYSFEKSDLIDLNKHGVNCKFLPASADQHIFYPLNIEKTIDISFVGSMYPIRRKILNRLAEDFTDLNLEFYGGYASIKNPFRYFRYLFSPVERKVFRNKSIPPEEVNIIYNKSKIVLNIQHEQSMDGWNGKVPETMLTKTFCVVNTNPAVESEFGRFLGLFTSYDELLGIIKFHLNNYPEREKKARNGFRFVLDKYTFDISYSKLINDILTLNLNHKKENNNV